MSTGRGKVFAITAMAALAMEGAAGVAVEKDKPPPFQMRQHFSNKHRAHVGFRGLSRGRPTPRKAKRWNSKHAKNRARRARKARRS